MHHMLLLTYFHYRYQLERGEGEQRLHMHLYLHLNRPMRWAWIQGWVSGQGLAHPNWQALPEMANRFRAWQYCGKEETRVAGPFELGNQLLRPKEEATEATNKLSDLVEILKTTSGDLSPLRRRHLAGYAQHHRGLLAAALALAADTPRHEPEVYIFFGDSGTGKSRLAHEMSPTLHSIPAGNKGTYDWAATYNGKRDVLFDDFCSGTNRMPFDRFLVVLDRYKLEYEVKGGFVSFNPKKIFFTSNRAPWEWYDLSTVGDPKAMFRRIGGPKVTVVEFSAESQSEWDGPNQENHRIISGPCIRLVDIKPYLPLTYDYSSWKTLTWPVNGEIWASIETHRKNWATPHEIPAHAGAGHEEAPLVFSQISEIEILSDSEIEIN